MVGRVEVCANCAAATAAAGVQLSFAANFAFAGRKRGDRLFFCVL
jgi:hypothetical protein